MTFELYEIARRNMVIFSAHFITHNVMTKEQFFKLQKRVLDDFKKQSQKQGDKLT